MKKQTGTSVTGDFEDNTWTFEMEGDFKVAAGEFAIIPKDKYDNLIAIVYDMRNGIASHTDNERESKFDLLVNNCDKAVNDIED